MTEPRPENLERERDKLYLCDAELYRRIGLPRSVIHPLIPNLENKHSFPRKDPLFGGRRYWPAVKAWLDRHNGLKIDAPQPLRQRHG